MSGGETVLAVEDSSSGVQVSLLLLLLLLLTCRAGQKDHHFIMNPEDPLDEQQEDSIG